MKKTAPEASTPFPLATQFSLRLYHTVCYNDCPGCLNVGTVTAVNMNITLKINLKKQKIIDSFYQTFQSQFKRSSLKYWLSCLKPWVRNSYGGN